MRLSIASVMLFLLITLSILIIGVGYLALDKILIAAASNDLHHEGKQACRKISNYLLPLIIINKQVKELINNSIIKPEHPEQMMKFLHSINDNETRISGAFWWNNADDFFLINSPEGGETVEEINIFGQKHGNKTIQKFYDNKHNLINTITTNQAKYYAKPWAQKAIATKKTVSVIFTLAQLGSQKKQLGVTTAQPFYDKNGSLLGIFGVEMLIKNIAKYINNIEAAKNSLVFIINDIGTTIDEFDDNITIISPKNTDVALKQASLQAYQQAQKTPFTFTFNNEKYISAYEQITGLQTGNTWFIAIITPANSIIKPLRDKIFFDLILILSVIPLILLLISLFANKISNPIKVLAQDANLISKLELSRAKGTTTFIKEIAAMNHAFMLMKNTMASFQRYMPLALVKKLIASGKIAAVGGENQELTIMFTDIENFTGLSENMQSQKLMLYLSSYFQIITKIIIETNGTIDKYIGDGMMAFWGAPVNDEHHALHACQAAIKIQAALVEFNKINQQSGWPVMRTRIGINTGNVIVGNIGSDERLNYTALGKGVSTANHLEGLNKKYQTTIIVSETTYALVKHKFKLILLDHIPTKDKKRKLAIYELLSEQNCQLKQNNQEAIL